MPPKGIVAVLALLVAALLIAREVHRTLATYGPAADAHRTINLQDYDSPALGLYYLDAGRDSAAGTNRKANVRIGPQGVPVAIYGSKAENNAVTVAQYALELYHNVVNRHSREDERAFLRQADWLVEHCKSGCVYTFAHPPQISRTRWISGMAQGQLISVALRAFQLTHEPQYFTAAKYSLQLLKKPVSDGGTLATDANGAWFEEYPQSPPTHVLNGDMFALFGVWDYYRVTKDPDAKALFERGIAALREGLARSDTGFWGRYDLLHAGLCTRAYMDLEIAQARILTSISGDAAIRALADRFQSYEASPITFFKIRYYNLRHPGGLREILDTAGHSAQSVLKDNADSNMLSAFSR
ncbi:MAG: D-glucuronyl C5-epimerase family protein [Candidatus Eremiobacteraeota bacterium]|nr:D-glucuronyl C5-epimerase family protein [Candidatus Eremiobacteraeota bacterium]